MKVIYRFFKVLYTSIYFYFFPFLTLILTYLVGTAVSPGN